MPKWIYRFKAASTPGSWAPWQFYYNSPDDPSFRPFRFFLYEIDDKKAPVYNIIFKSGSREELAMNCILASIPLENAVLLCKLVCLELSQILNNENQIKYLLAEHEFEAMSNAYEMLEDFCHA